jgi:Gluconate 2-dehydrogenase subunit 3
LRFSGHSQPGLRPFGLRLDSYANRALNFASVAAAALSVNERKPQQGGDIMTAIERRAFVRGAGLGALVFTVGGVEVMLTPRQARAEGVPLRTLTADQAATLDAIGETLVPGAKEAGITNFVDQQISIPPEQALLQARILNVRPPFANFYRAALAAIDNASNKTKGKKFAALTASEQHDFVGLMRVGKIEGWQGPPGPFVFNVLRSDAVDVVYNTVEGYAALGIPYMPHIAPTQKW